MYAEDPESASGALGALDPALAAAYALIARVMGVSGLMVLSMDHGITGTYRINQAIC